MITCQFTWKEPSVAGVLLCFAGLVHLLGGALVDGGDVWGLIFGYQNQGALLGGGSGSGRRGGGALS